MDLTNYQLLDTPVTVSRTDIGMIAKVGDDNKPLQMYEILLARSNELIVRAVGMRRSTTPVKVVLPIIWDPNGHVVDGVKYQFYKKADVVIGPKSGKVKRVGPKRAEGEKSKLDVCRELWTANPNANAVDMKAKFVSEGKCTPAGANTYYLKIKAENAK